MTTTGIVLLVIGIAAFIASFFIPDKDDKEDKKDIEKKREQIRKLIDTEIDGMKLRVNEATNESVEYSMDKSERALEKITNDKIMAVSEYATTVIEEIDRNHKEVMFLYDMLNDKQTDIKNTVRHAEAAVKEANDAVKTLADTAQYVSDMTDAVNVAVNGAQDVIDNVNAAVQAVPVMTQPSINPIIQTPANEPTPQELFATSSISSNDTFSTGLKASAPTESVFGMAVKDDFNDSLSVEPLPIAIPVAQEQEKAEEEMNEFELLEKNTKFTNMSNNNQKILMMNSQGIPVVDIARQLSLGVGEVQLVIDLFK